MIRRKSDWVHLMGSVVGLLIIGVALAEHALQDHTADQYTIVLLIIGGVLINPLAILSLVMLARRGRAPGMSEKCATCGLWLSRLQEPPPDAADQPKP